MTRIVLPVGLLVPLLLVLASCSSTAVGSAHSVPAASGDSATAVPTTPALSVPTLVPGEGSAAVRTHDAPAEASQSEGMAPAYVAAAPPPAPATPTAPPAPTTFPESPGTPAPTEPAATPTPQPTVTAVTTPTATPAPTAPADQPAGPDEARITTSAGSLFPAGIDADRDTDMVAIEVPEDVPDKTDGDWPDRELTPSGPVDWGDEVDPEWFITGLLDYPLEWVDDSSYNAGFSTHVAVWPWQEVHAGPRFAGGLPGTWMSTLDADHGYSTIEGGVGIGSGNRWPSQGGKFTMGGVSSEFTHWANGPGAGGGLEGGVHWEDWSWEVPQGKYGVAQLSPHVLFPPDGLNMAADSNGQFLGYGYHPLPLIDARTTSGTYGEIETGNQSWTLFMNTANFNGPVAFFLPDFYSYPAVNVAEVAAGLHQVDESPFLDTMGSSQNQQFANELWEIPAVQAVDANGTPYVKTTRTQFPANGGDPDSSIILRNITAYQRGALWDSTEAWFAGGDTPSGELAPAATLTKRFEQWDFANDYLGWMIIPEGVEDGDAEYRIDWTQMAKVDVSDPHTFRYRWNLDLVERVHGNFVLPEYFRLDDDPTASFGKVWTPILEEDVPAETGLVDHVFDELTEPQDNTNPFETPTDPDSPWQSPGPASDTFQVALGDGSVVEYAWYRFVDQPAMRYHSFTDAEREVIQQRVEMIHRAWTPERSYLTPPTAGELVSLDEGVLVTPPAGMEVGYVPIVTRQALAGE